MHYKTGDQLSSAPHTRQSMLPRCQSGYGATAKEAIRRAGQRTRKEKVHSRQNQHIKKLLTSLKSWMLQMKYGVFGLRLSIYTQSLKEKNIVKQWHLP